MHEQSLAPRVITHKFEEIDDNAYAKFWVTNKVYCGRCANSEFQLDQESNGRRWLGAGFFKFHDFP